MKGNDTLENSVKEFEELAKKYEELYPQQILSPDVMNKEPKKLSEQQVKNISLIKNIGNGFHEMLELLPKSREISLAKTKLEEVVMWAVKGITSSER